MQVSKDHLTGTSAVQGNLRIQVSEKGSEKQIRFLETVTEVSSKNGFQLTGNQQYRGRGIFSIRREFEGNTGRK